LSATAPASFRLAKRLDEVGFSDIVQIRNRVMELRVKGAAVYQFEGGEPYRPTPDYIKQAVTAALQENKTRYAPSSGIPELRRAIADKLRTGNNIHAKEENVIVVNGGMQGLFGAFQSTIDPGDDVLIFSPYWTPIKDLVAHCGGRLVLVPTDEARAEGVGATLRRYATANTRAIYFNTPTNPSGVVFTREESEEVASLAIDRDLVVVADEAYEDIVYEGEQISIASLPGMFERTITTFTLSKSYAMTGWRLGYAVAPKALAAKLDQLMINSSSCAAGFTQIAAIEALSAPESAHAVSRMVKVFEHRRDLIVDGINAIPGMRCTRPQGAFYAFPNIQGTGFGERELADRLLTEAGVAVLPGTAFGDAGKGYIRIAYTQSEDELSRGLQRIAEFVSKHKP